MKKDCSSSTECLRRYKTMLGGVEDSTFTMKQYPENADGVNYELVLAAQVHETA